MKWNRLFLLLVVLTILASCGKRKSAKVAESEGVSEQVVAADDITFRVRVERFDRDLAALNPHNFGPDLDTLIRRYNPYFELYTQYVVQMGKVGTPEFVKNLKLFLTDSVMNEVYDTVQVRFPNLNNLETDLTMGFERFRAQFPQRHVPRVLASVSGFNQSIVVGDSVIGIGLDKYLGSSCSFYQHLGLPLYKRRDMIPQRMASDVMLAFALTEFPFNDSVDNLLSNMIFEGRALYFAKQMLPNVPDSLIIGYSASQLRWCKMNEKAMWTFLAEQRLLFNIDRLTIRKFISEAPFTAAFTSESPGRAGVWIGWRIVDSYMKRNKEVTLGQLMDVTDYQRVLSQSGYKP
jgi:hypothetical protein